MFPPFLGNDMDGSIGAFITSSTTLPANPTATTQPSSILVTV